MALSIIGLRVSRDGKEIVRGVDLEVPAGQVHALMGPNGSGKSSLANALMGHPKYVIEAGRVLLDGEDVTRAAPDKKSKAGLFLSMQYPAEIPGLSVANFLRAALNARRPSPISVVEFHRILKQEMEALKIDPSFAARGLNEGFSGGEKKRMEVLPLALLKPKYAVLDETDSGLDVDALKVVTAGINRARGRDMGILLITHYARILRYLKPDRVHVMSGGRVVLSGGAELAERIEKEGYEALPAAGRRPKNRKSRVIKK